MRFVIEAPDEDIRKLLSMLQDSMREVVREVVTPNTPISIKKYSEQTGIPVSTIYDMIKAGKLVTEDAGTKKKLIYSDQQRAREMKAKTK